MARSQLLKDLVSGNVSIENVLLRLKIILSDLENDSIMLWVNGELQGYKSVDELPSYRTFEGSPIGTFIINYTTKYSNSQVPLESLIDDKELIKTIVTVHITDGISTIEKMLNGNNRDRYAKQIPTTFCHQISKETLQLAGMHVQVPSNNLEGIVSHVKSKLLDIIMELEKQFENLDELDIKSQIEEDNSKKENTVYNIEQIIYDSQSIEMGDSNKIKGSTIGNLFRRK